MKKYHYHPDHFIVIMNEDKVYIEHVSLAKFDMQREVVRPPEHTTEFHYIFGYGTRYFTKGDMTSFSDEPRPELDDIIMNLDQIIQKKKIRESNVIDWNIPEDMK